MEDKCSIRSTNLKELIKSAWFKKSMLALAIGVLLGLLLFGFYGDSPYANNIYGDLLAGIVVGLFFIRIPCLSCNFSRE